MNLLAALVPYVAVLLGMYLFHNAWLTILLYHAGVIAFLLYRKPSGVWHRMWAGMKSPLLVPGILGCALAAPILYFMWPWFASSNPVLPAWMAHYGLSGLAWTLLIPYFSIVHPILEEVHWRGISPERITWICWQDFLFAGYHVLVLFQVIRAPWLFFVFSILLGSSVFWRWTVARYGGYGIAIASHVAADTAVIIGVQFLLQA